jgi:hypothetical protein
MMSILKHLCREALLSFCRGTRSYSSADGFIGGGSHRKRPHPGVITSIRNGCKRKTTSDVMAALSETRKALPLRKLEAEVVFTE